MWYESVTTIHKGCWWDYLYYFMFRFAEQCCVSIYYSNFFFFPSCHSYSCWKPRFEHISFLFPLIWHIILIFQSCPKVYRQIWLDAKIRSMIDIWGGHTDVDARFNLTQSKVNISFFSFFSWVYIWQLKCYLKLIIVWFPLVVGNAGTGGICAAAYKVRVSSMYRTCNY
jgi:hypothetical protein